MEVSKHDPMIVWFDNALEKDFCKKVIKKFDKDKRTYKGVTRSGYDPKIKQSMDLSLNDLEDWKEEDEVFYQSLKNGLKEYFEYVKQFNGTFHIDVDTGYQIQKTEPGGFYTWHHDFCIDSELSRSRTLTYIWYLNTPKAGHTEFSCGERVKPKRGRLVLFPATWDRVHRGTPPKTPKYLCTGWCWSCQDVD